MCIPKAEPSPLRLGLLFYGALAAVALLWRSVALGESIWHPTAAPASLSWPMAAGIGALCGLAVVVLSDRFSEGSAWGRAMTRELADAIGPISLLDALLLALASGFAEELLFRGALQPAVGLWLASAIFALAHFTPQRRLWPWVAFTGLAGLGLGLLYDATGQLAAPIAAHVVVNGINLPRLSRLSREGEPRSRSRSEPPAEALPPAPSPGPEPDRSGKNPRTRC